MEEELKSMADLSYVVFKGEDLKCLTDTELEILTCIQKRINEHRAANNKNRLLGLFINQEWECFDGVMKILINWIEKKEREAECKYPIIH